MKTKTEYNPRNAPQMSLWAREYEIREWEQKSSTKKTKKQLQEANPRERQNLQRELEEINKSMLRKHKQE